MNQAVLRRFIMLMAVLVVVGFIGSDFIRGYIQRPPGDYETQLGDQRLQDGLYDEAMAYFEQALEKQPDHRGALMGKAIVYLRKEQWIEAVADLDYLIDFLRANQQVDDPTGTGALAAAYANRGIAYDYQGEYKKGLDDYIRSLEIDADTVAGPGVIHKILYGSERVSSVRDRARYLWEEFQKPESERLLRVPELDARQRMHKP